jgi:hypothetical protein
MSGREPNQPLLLNMNGRELGLCDHRRFGLRISIDPANLVAKGEIDSA